MESQNESKPTGPTSLNSNEFVERSDREVGMRWFHFLPYRQIRMPTVLFLEVLRLYSIFRPSSHTNVVFSIWVILTQYFSCSSMQKTLKSENGFKLFEYRFNQGGVPPESIAYIMLQSFLISKFGLQPHSQSSVTMKNRLIMEPLYIRHHNVDGTIMRWFFIVTFLHNGAIYSRSEARAVLIRSNGVENFRCSNWFEIFERGFLFWAKKIHMFVF